MSFKSLRENVLGKNMETTMSRKGGGVELTQNPFRQFEKHFRSHKTKSKILESMKAKHKDKILESSQ